MATLDTVIAPHAVSDGPALRALVAAYEADATVPPPVAIDFGHACVALSGSHRIAAMREVYEGDTDLEMLAIVLNGEELYEAADEAARETLDAIAAGRVGDYAEAIEGLWTLLPEEAREALADQR